MPLFLFNVVYISITSTGFLRPTSFEWPVKCEYTPYSCLSVIWIVLHVWTLVYIHWPLEDCQFWLACIKCEFTPVFVYCSLDWTSVHASSCSYHKCRLTGKHWMCLGLCNWLATCECALFGSAIRLVMRCVYQADDEMYLSGWWWDVFIRLTVMCCTYKADDEMCLLGWRCLCCV